MTPLHFAEWMHAVAAQIFRGYMTTVEAGRVQHEFEDDRNAGLWVNIDVPDNAFNVFADLGAGTGQNSLPSLTAYTLPAQSNLKRSVFGPLMIGS